MLYLVCGLPGAGKTTFARKLGAEKAAAVFTLDEQTHKLYGELHACEWGVRERATKYQLLQDAFGLLRSGNSVVLDYGFFKEQERNWYQQLSESIGVESELYYVTTSYEIMLERVLARNNEKDNIHEIDKELLGKLIQQFEEPIGDGFVKIQT